MVRIFTLLPVASKTCRVLAAIANCYIMLRPIAFGDFSAREHRIMDFKQLAYFVRVAELGSFTRASTALDIALNACAALFVLEADDILAAGPWFSERLRADVEKHSVVRLTRRQEARLRLSTYAHITAVAMAVLVPMVISWADALVEADDTVALTGSTGITHPRIFIADLAYFLVWCASLIETLLTTPGARRKLVGVLRLLLLWLLAMVVRYVLTTGVLERELKESEVVGVGSYFVPFGPSQGKL